MPTAQIEEISILASAVLGDQDKGVKWLSEPNIAMDSKAPIDCIGEQAGYERVKNLLLRIEYGALA
jgi:putative toxin-antitoxin system antitoxin component (TIGR02293 family)